MKNKEKQHMIIAFNESSFNEIAEMLEIKNFKCKFCGINITKKNVGGFVHPNKLFCKSQVCLIRHILNWDGRK